MPAAPVPAPVELPRADPTKADPLRERPIEISRNPQVTTPKEPDIKVNGGLGSRSLGSRGSSSRESGSRGSSSRDSGSRGSRGGRRGLKAPAAASTEQRLPMGSVSVLAAYNRQGRRSHLFAGAGRDAAELDRPAPGDGADAAEQYTPTEADLNAFSPAPPPASGRTPNRWRAMPSPAA